MIYESIKLMHKISFECYPPALNQYLFHSLVRSDISRLVRKTSVTYISKTAKTANSFMHRLVYIYNTLPDVFRALPKKRFSSELKKYIKNTYDLKNIPKIETK